MGYTRKDVRCAVYCGLQRTPVLIAEGIDQLFVTGLNLWQANMAVVGKASKLPCP